MGAIMTDTPLNAAREFLRQYGIRPQIVSQNRHIKLRFEYMGQTRQLIVSSTPSDRCAHLQVRRELRRMLRAI
jgi:hypothetical protein